MKKIHILICSLLLLAGTFTKSEAQVRTFLSPYSLSTDTVTNTATVYVTSPINKGASATTVIVVTVTKISGTVAGTISLQGSIDGTNYKALNTIETQTALATVTATDASNVYSWRLTGNPFIYYRVSWTGTGTMSASFGAKCLSH